MREVDVRQGLADRIPVILLVASVLGIAGLGYLIWSDHPGQASVLLEDDFDGLPHSFGIGRGESTDDDEVQLGYTTFVLTASDGLRSGGEWVGSLNISATIANPEPDDTVVVFLPRDAVVRAPTNDLDEGDVWRSAEVADLENGVQVQIPVSSFAAAGGIDGGFDFTWVPQEVRPLGIDRAQMVVRYSMFSRVVRKVLDGVSSESAVPAPGFSWRPLPRTKADGTDNTVSIELRLPDPNDRFEETSPIPASLSFRSRRWDAPVANAMVIEVVAENEWTRRQLDLARNVLFLLLGVFIAELPRVLPRLRSRA